jgi:hypothetical protein
MPNNEKDDKWKDKQREEKNANEEVSKEEKESYGRGNKKINDEGIRIKRVKK